MRSLSPWIAVLLAAAAAAGCGAAQNPPTADGAPLALETTIPLAGVTGRIDHLALDLAHRRLYVAELGAGSVEALDLASGRSIRRIGGLKEPQGLAYLPALDQLAVATGGDGLVRFYRANDLSLVGSVEAGPDADNLRLDFHTGELVVGADALVVIDPATRRVLRRTPLPAHAEGFQLGGADAHAHVNVPGVGGVFVVDLASGRTTGKWSVSGAALNYPLAFDPASNRVAVVFRAPPRLVLLDARSGRVLANLPTCGDSDDVFFDAGRRRLYVSCGGGAVDVFDEGGAGYRRQASIPSRPGARTSLFSPDLDRLYVAAPRRSGEEAAVLVYRPRP